MTRFWLSEELIALQALKNLPSMPRHCITEYIKRKGLAAPSLRDPPIPFFPLELAQQWEQFPHPTMQCGDSPRGTAELIKGVHPYGSNGGSN